MVQVVARVIRIYRGLKNGEEEKEDRSEEGIVSLQPTRPERDESRPFNETGSSVLEKWKKELYENSKAFYFSENFDSKDSKNEGEKSG